MVRRAYQAMLEWARTVVQGRTAGQTPASYGETLARAVPQDPLTARALARFLHSSRRP